MSGLFRFPQAAARDPAVELWMRNHPDTAGMIAQHWIRVMRGAGSEVRELLHDGHPTFCVGDAAFAYVDAFKEHVNVGFFRGAELADPDHLLVGSGKWMRHVRVEPEWGVDAKALTALIETAYADMRRRVQAEMAR